MLTYAKKLNTDFDLSASAGVQGRQENTMTNQLVQMVVW
jgi:hypothetical protein